MLLNWVLPNNFILGRDRDAVSQRLGLYAPEANATAGLAVPTFAPGQLLIHQYPDPSGKPLGELVAGEGAPPPDRVKLNSWNSPLPQAE